MTNLTRRFFWSLGFAAVITALALLAGAGCESRAKARADAKAAFLAGQNAALQRTQSQVPSTNEPPSGASVAIVGEVKNHVLAWSPGFTLGDAVVQADYNGATDPVSIIIRRKGADIAVDPKRLLNGEDVPLEAGDIVQIQ